MPYHKVHRPRGGRRQPGRGARARAAPGMALAGGAGAPGMALAGAAGAGPGAGDGAGK